MKIRQGFVSNSSSSSYVVYLPDEWNPTDKEILKNIDETYPEKELDEKKAIEKVKKAIGLLKEGESIYEEGEDTRMEYSILSYKLIPKAFILSSIDTGPDSGVISGVSRKKLSEIEKKIKKYK